MFEPVIGIASAPNADTSDRRLAAKLLVSPRRWLRGEEISLLEERFRQMYHTPGAYSFETGQAALYQILKCLGIGPGDEVILQAYTCVVVPDAIIWAGAEPIYADTGADLNLDPALIETKITPQTKAIIVQHTFGVPADLTTLRKIADDRHLKLIEDCAHIIDPRLAGTVGDAAFFSFGQEKAISSTQGGLALTRDDRLDQALKKAQESLPFPDTVSTIRRIIHPLIWGIINPTYYWFGLGKAIIVLSRVLGLSRPLVSVPEASAVRPSNFPKRMANAQAVRALHQLDRVAVFNKSRRETGHFYQGKLTNLPGVTLPPLGEFPYLRFNLLVSDPERLRRFAKRYHIILGYWYNVPIYPADTDLAVVHYEPGCCPAAEQASRQSVNLPTYPMMKTYDRERVVRMMEDYVRVNT